MQESHVHCKYYGIHKRMVGLADLLGLFRLWWRSAPIKKFRGTEQYDWLQNGFFTSQSLHYDQDFYDWELQAWMEKWHGCQHGSAFLLGESSRGQVCWATSKPQTLG